MKPATCVPSATIHCNGCTFWIGVHGSLESTRCGARGTGNGPHTLRAGCGGSTVPFTRARNHTAPPAIRDDCSKDHCSAGAASTFPRRAEELIQKCLPPALPPAVAARQPRGVAVVRLQRLV